MPAGSDDAQRARAEARADLIRRLFAWRSAWDSPRRSRMTWVQNGAAGRPRTQPDCPRNRAAGSHSGLGRSPGGDVGEAAVRIWRFLINHAGRLHLRPDRTGANRAMSAAGGESAHPAAAIETSMPAGSRARRTSRPADALAWCGYSSCSRSSETGAPSTSAPPACSRSWAGGLLDRHRRRPPRWPRPMRRRILVIFVTLIAATVYFAPARRVRQPAGRPIVVGRSSPR